MALQSAWIRRLRPAGQSSKSKLFSKATDLSNNLCVKENEDNDGSSLASYVHSGIVADEGFVRRKCIAQVFESGVSPALSFKKPELYQKEIAAFEEVSHRQPSESTAPQPLSKDSKDEFGKNLHRDSSKQVLEKLQDLDKASKSSPTVRTVTQPVLSLVNSDAEILATCIELIGEDDYEQNVTGFAPFRKSSRKPPLPPSKNRRIICRKALSRPRLNASQPQIVKFGSWSKQQYSILSLASMQRAVLAKDRSGKLDQHHGKVANLLKSVNRNKIYFEDSQVLCRQRRVNRKIIFHNQINKQNQSILPGVPMSCLSFPFAPLYLLSLSIVSGLSFRPVRAFPACLSHTYSLFLSLFSLPFKFA